MTSMLAQPELMATAAADAAGIGSAINQAKAAAAIPTTGVLAAAEDEVSAITASFFSTYGSEYQALLQQATTFHDQFVGALSAAANTYAQAETQIAASLGLRGGATTTAVSTAVKQAADPAVDAILIMTGSGTATPSTEYMNNVFSRYLNGVFTGPLQAVSTAEGLYPFTGVKDLTLDISLARGVTELNNAVNLAISPGTTQSVSILGYSQSSIVASMVMPQLLAQGFTNGVGGSPVQAYFTLLGDPANPNGGLFARFPGLSLPSLGATFGAATPSNDYPTTVYTLEYDGFADFPRYPINFLADLNALAGIVFVHGTYPTLTASQLSQAFLLPGSASLGTTDSLTDYYMIPTENLPLLTPLRYIPVIGNPLADLVQPDLRYLINWGYGDPNYGYSTSPANVPTPFGFLPPLSATTALGPLLVSGTQEGVNAFVADISAITPPSLSSLLSGAGSTGGAALTLPAAPAIPSPTDIISAIETANTTFVGAVTNNFATAYATLLPTADIATAVAISLPSYDLNLFLNGITQAINGDPVGGLTSAFGDPIAADVGLITLAGGFEFINIANAADTIFTGNPNPGPN